VNHAYKYKCSPLVGIVKMKNSLGTLVLFHVYNIICIYLLVMYTRHAIFSYIHYFARTHNSVTSLWLVYINTSTIQSIGTLRVITIITLTSIGVFTDRAYHAHTPSAKFDKPFRHVNKCNINNSNSGFF